MPQRPHGTRRRKMRLTSFSGVSVKQSRSDVLQVIANEPNLIGIVESDGMFRAAIFLCPCGCGDKLTINLDPRSGDAWRVRLRGDRLTLMPSVWRASGCRSHFVLWENSIWWISESDEEADSKWPPAMRRELRHEWDKIRRNKRNDLPG
jgi:hypothetical protein